MVVGAIGSRTELAVVGAGPGGYVAALRAADSGLEVCLIDSGPLGGTCLNIGCIPSKTLIEIADVAQRARTLGLGSGQAVDMSAIHAEVSGVAAGLRSGIATLLADAGVTVLGGHARLVRKDRLNIEADGEVTNLEFDNAIIATGSRPLPLPNFPFGDRIVDSASLLHLDRLPPALAVVGGGYIGVELGTAFAKLGSSVTIIEAEESILAGVPAALREPVERRLGALSVDVRTSRRALAPTRSGLELDDGSEVPADVILVAIGRRPNSDGCGLSAAGVDVDRHGFIQVDEYRRATRSIYAIGDVIPGPALAHRASADAEIAVSAIVGRPALTDPVVPSVIFSDPEIVSVGVGLDEAVPAGLAVHRFPHRALARAHTVGRVEGMSALVVDPAGTVVGFHAVGPHVSELAGEATLAIEMAATAEDVAATIHPHPTISESIPEAAHLAVGLPLHVRRSRRDRI